MRRRRLAPLTATLNGTLTSIGAAPTTVIVYYGTADQGQTTVVGAVRRALAFNRSAR